LFGKKHKAPVKTQYGVIDAQSFEDIYNLYWEKVYAICYNQIREIEPAQEMVQDIFKSLWERKDDLEITGPMEHYLSRAAKFKVFEYIRNNSTRKKHMDCALIDYCESSNCTEEDVFFNNLKQEVGVLVDKLPCQCQRVYKMSRVEHMTNKEIASSLLISERAVEQHLSKALRFLRTNLHRFRS